MQTSQVVVCGGKLCRTFTMGYARVTLTEKYDRTLSENSNDKDMVPSLGEEDIFKHSFLFFFPSPILLSFLVYFLFPHHQLSPLYALISTHRLPSSPYSCPVHEFFLCFFPFCSIPPPSASPQSCQPALSVSLPLFCW